MRLQNVIYINAPWERVLALAADVERWPERLPHYRRVRLLQRQGRRTTAEMAARRGRIPVRWLALQEVRPEERRILFTHTGGLTRGMAVEWTFTPSSPGVRVAIVHVLPWRPPLSWIAEAIVGRLFIAPIANRTLRRIKALSEAGGAG
ncbi:MAG: SRPBCC family protein [Armatimonadota bacterium]|nr:SRPBCC family protein [Armatimonadota bacterium]MDR7428340.1 SRPBCC family protein [Armatimonadota bacterium]MDR7463206.1 SRPBCC family protein [Armatimonadota bacterium]MDR7469414.1 SRPBCC family protein [Armatimonadota bacterium]MDR7474750.1 SRPBCC family protein [Armatimonadota bacterium]